MPIKNSGRYCRPFLFPRIKKREMNERKKKCILRKPAAGFAEQNGRIAVKTAAGYEPLYLFPLQFTAIFKLEKCFRIFKEYDKWY